MRRIAGMIVWAAVLVVLGMPCARAASVDSVSLNAGLDRLFKKGLAKGTAGAADEGPLKSATMLMLAAKQNPSLVSPDNRFVLFRPTDPADADYYGAGVTVLTYDTANYFKIHYVEDTSDDDAVYGADNIPATIPEFVIKLGVYLEQIRAEIIASRGYLAPPNDAPAGGDFRFDVYLKDLNAYGYTSYELGATIDPYMVIENDFDDPDMRNNLDADPRLGALKITAAHEFFHAVQFQYGIESEDAWWAEASSTWMEDEVYPSVNDYLNYLGYKYDDANDNGRWDSGETYYQVDGITAIGTVGRPTNRWFDHPGLSLDSTGDATAPTQEYGTAIWASYLAETYGAEIIKSIWEAIAAGQPPLAAIAAELVGRGDNLAGVYGDFMAENFRLEKYADRSYYPLIWHETSDESYPQSIAGTVDALAAAFHAFKPASSVATLSFTFQGMNGGNLAVRLLLIDGSGTVTARDVTLDSATVISRVNTFGTGSTYRKVVALVMNTSTTSDDEPYAMSVSTEEDSVTVAAAGGGGGGGCFIATAAYGSILAPEVEALRRFRDRYLLRSGPGRMLVALYYRISPPLAELIGADPRLRVLARWLLAPLVLGIGHPLAAAAVTGSGVAAAGLGLRRRRRERV